MEPGLKTMLTGWWVVLLPIMITIMGNLDGSALRCSSTTVSPQRRHSTDRDFDRMLSKCSIYKSNFDQCINGVLNDLTVYFPTGVAKYNIRPFDPHHADFVELRRGDQNGVGGFKLSLNNVSEYGWSKSKVTQFNTDFDQNKITYSQSFPEKSLEGWYAFDGKILGTAINRQGYWNMTLYDYSQTTSVRRLGSHGSPLKVHIAMDKLGGLKMHVGNMLGGPGRPDLDALSDGIINSMWPVGLPFIRPIINELVSTAFTDIFDESFRHFPIERFFTYSF